MFFSTVVAGALALASTSLAAPANELEVRSNCRNGPRTRDCWGNGWDINCDYDEKWPQTGRTRYYDFHITSGPGGVAGSKAPLDGHQREVLLVNGQYPGPTIEADWGDTIQVTVHNDLDPGHVDNGTSIHWHGLRQYLTNTQDGTNGITECPVAPGSKKVYKFVATAYGSSWYHSHYSIQYANGVVGPIVIHGPASANYDIDLGPVLLTDWFYTEAFALYEQAKVAQGPPTADNILINGKQVSASGGSYFTATLTPGKRHLVRFVNVGINDFFHVKLDGHRFKVIAADFVPVKPFYVDELVLGVGQRYDVIIKANQKKDNYWLHVGTGNAGNFGPTNPPCDGPLATEGKTKAVFSYKGAPAGLPTGTGSGNLTAGCGDLDHALTPVVSTTVPSGGINDDFEVGFAPANTSVQGQYVSWFINDSSIAIDWNKPTLKYVQDGNTNYPKDDNVFTIDVAPNAVSPRFQRSLS